MNGYFPFTPPKSKAEWDPRADYVRRQILVSQGLWPMPTKTPLEAVVHGKVEREDYTVEKVFFQSLPGHFVTGSLYRPKGKTGKLPGVLNPHGHWANGRFYDNDRIARDEDWATRFASGGWGGVYDRVIIDQFAFGFGLSHGQTSVGIEEYMTGVCHVGKE